MVPLKKSFASHHLENMTIIKINCLLLHFLIAQLLHHSVLLQHLLYQQVDGSITAPADSQHKRSVPVDVSPFQALQVWLLQQHLDQFGASARDRPVQRCAPHQDGVVPAVDVDARLAEQQLHDVGVVAAGRVHQPGNPERASLVRVLPTVQCTANSLQVAEDAMDPHWSLLHDVAEKERRLDKETFQADVLVHTGYEFADGPFSTSLQMDIYRSYTLNANIILTVHSTVLYVLYTTCWVRFSFHFLLAFFCISDLLLHGYTCVI